MTEVDLADVQGNILHSYGRSFRCVRHLVLRVADPARARAALGEMVTGERSGPEVTSAELAPRHADFGWCLNVGITYRGLAALGVPASTLSTFPAEFRAGMIARAPWLGDVGPSAPEHWVGGLDDPDRAHLIVTIHGHSTDNIEAISEAVVGAQGGSAFDHERCEELDGAFFAEPHEDQVHFGYRDGLSNVRFAGIHEASDPSQGALAPIGTVLLGHPSPIPHVMWGVPRPSALGGNGSFNAFRVLRQDVRAFEAFLVRAAALAGCSAEEVAAKLCGRWRNGAPLSLAPTEAEVAALPDPRTNDFSFSDDPDGARCPIGSHIRRCNPRDAQIVQRGTNDARALVRRGMPYGPPYDPAAGAVDDVPRGLLGNFICASLASQFEALQLSWLNLGLQDPRITGTNDPLVGANEASAASFAWSTSTGDQVLVDRLPSFVTTAGGAYCFLPSLTAIRWIASEGWRDRDKPPRRRFPALRRAGP